MRAATEITVTSGERLMIAGTVAETERALSDAARSGQSRLAWFTEEGQERPIGLNPAHVISLRSGSDTAPGDQD